MGETRVNHWYTYTFVSDQSKSAVVLKLGDSHDYGRDRTGRVMCSKEADETAKGRSETPGISC